MKPGQLITWYAPIAKGGAAETLNRQRVNAVLKSLGVSTAWIMVEGEDKPRRVGKDWIEARKPVAGVV